MKQERAMTLIESMLGVAIAVTLTSLALPSYIEFVRKNRPAEQAVLIPYFEKDVKLGPTNLHCHRARGPQWADGLSHARLATVLGVGAAQ